MKPEASVLKRGFSACLYQGPRNWVVQGLLQGACQNLRLRLEKNAKKRKAPEYGALVVSTVMNFAAKALCEVSGLCSMAVHRALKRCTVCWHCTKQMWELACLR
ncbi:hypothetical protein E1K68_02615 [Pseudomonas sp. B2021]|uniref:Uncharacterized protein n=1 Tax=Pseudomonas lactis TaxID=1615674 RepID=I4KEM9_9PSED|nr:hypothetical protein PflSS101_0367 [Pseudomonas lactis]MBR7211685.1 hypothetical protein [Pseudomonas sp. B2021]